MGRGASLGANATIVCGIEIGEWAVVAAGAVVTTDVPAYGLVVGAPARLAGVGLPAAATARRCRSDPLPARVHAVRSPVPRCDVAP